MNLVYGLTFLLCYYNIVFAQKGHVTEHEHYEKMYNTASAKKFFEKLMKKDITHEFVVRITIPKSTEECYYEECDEDAQLLTSFQDETKPSVTSNGLLQASLRFPNGSLVEMLKEPGKKADFDHTCTLPGTYEFCIHNTVPGSSNEKTIRLEIIVIHHQDITDFHYKYQENVENDTMYNIYDNLYQRARDVALMKLAIIKEKVYGDKDWNIVQYNNKMITVVSFFTICLVLSVTFGQIYLVKRMFKVDDRPRNGWF